MKDMIKGKKGVKVIQDNLDSLKLAFSLSKRLVIHSLLRKILGSLLLVFYSSYFVQFILKVADQEHSVDIWSIGLIGLVTLLLQIYIYKVDKIIIPAESVRFYEEVYRKVHQESEHHGTSLCEDEEQYQKSLITLDGVGEKMLHQVRSLSNLVGGVIGGITAGLTMLFIDPWTILLLTGPALCIFLLEPKIRLLEQQRHAAEESADRVKTYMNRIMYLREYTKDLRLSNIYHILIKKYKGSCQKKSFQWRIFFTVSFWQAVLKYISTYMVLFEGVLLYGAVRVLVTTKSPISFQTVAVLASLMITAAFIFADVIHSMNQCMDNCENLKDVRSILTYEELMLQDEQGIAPSSQLMCIDFFNVSFSYDGIHKVLDNVTFRIIPGSNTAIVGCDGAGKSTLLMLLLRFYDPTEGEIRVNNIDIKLYNLKKYRELYGCAFQKPTIFPETIRFNVLMGRNVTDFAAIDALTLVGLYDKVKTFSSGIETVLTQEYDDEGVTLSQEEEKLLGVARVIANAASVIIMDEPTSGLSVTAENQILSSIAKRRKGRTTLYLSNRLSCTNAVDRILVLERGKIVEQGTQQELLQLQKEYARLYHIQEMNKGLVQDEVTV